MSDLVDAAPPGTGELLAGRYRLLERVGSGGMGQVYRARDEVLGRDVAVKLFHTDGTDPADEHRRISEAKVLASLSHPSLVTLFDAHVEQGDHSFLVMEFVEGPTLRSRILSGPVDVADAVAMTRDLASGLEVVHEAGIVHRDIKPSNVMLRPENSAGRTFHAVLADFGVAHMSDATRQTTPGTVIGTAAYLAPEQVRGEQPIPESDIYALGLLLIEALTGRHPFGEGSMQETLLARLARQPEIPGTLGERWKALLTEMTAHDPSERPTAAEVADRAQYLTAAIDTNLDADETRVIPVEDTQRIVAAAAESRAASATGAASVVDTSEDDAATALVPVPAAEATRPERRRRPRPRGSRVGWLVAIVVLLLVAVAVAVVLLLNSLGAAQPESLPSLPSPLSEHMQQLLDGLTP